MGENSIDYTTIPLTALKKVTQNVLSTGLNQSKIIPNKDGLPRDWRGLAHLIGLTGVEMGWMATMADPMSSLLNYWGTKGNLSLLQSYLEVIDRFDVLDDSKELFESNSLEYVENLKKAKIPLSSVSLDSDKVILTTDDVIRLENGMEPQTYDAYVLYAEEDANFATQIVETMESKYNLKLCVRDRDLIGGVQFEHDAITKLIAERCRRLVVIVSSNFLKSKANKFFVTFAQALGLDIRERKVIPILYEKCNVPPELSYYFFLDYNRSSKLWNFWDKLRDSIQGPELTPGTRSRVVRREAVAESDPNGHWISRTRFDEAPEKDAGQTVKDTGASAPPAETDDEEDGDEDAESLKVTNKKRNVYKLIKNSFGKVVKGSGHSDRQSNSFLGSLTSFVTSSDRDLLDNLETSSESGDPKKVKKKKWFKKKSMETLLS